MEGINPACVAKHTKHQPTLEEFLCPKCGAHPPDGFCLDLSAARNAAGEEIDCEGNHVDDEMRCYECGYTTDGLSFAGAAQRKLNLVACKCCKGTGLVTKPKTKPKPKAKAKPKTKER